MSLHSPIHPATAAIARLKLRRRVGSAGGRLGVISALVGASVATAACQGERVFANGLEDGSGGDGGQRSSSGGGNTGGRPSGGGDNSGGQAGGNADGSGGDNGDGTGGETGECDSAFRDSDGECQPYTPCEPGEFVVTLGSQYADQDCQPCAAMTFSDVENAESCESWTVCDLAHLESASGTPETDTTCKAREWTRQTGAAGTTTYTSTAGLAVDSNGNVYAAGTVEGGGLPEKTVLGNSDLFLIKYDRGGSELWAVQFGTAGWDYGADVAVDENDDVYVAGTCDGDMDGQTSAGGSDACLIKFDAESVRIWTRFLGSTEHDFAYAVASDGNGGIYIGGEARGVLPDMSVSNDPSSGDAYLRKYSLAGTPVWTQQFGTDSSDEVQALAVDPDGNLVVAGNTNGILPGEAYSNSQDIYAAKFSAAGSPLWLTQVPSDTTDRAFAVAVDEAGRVYLGGMTSGAWIGETFLGFAYDAILVAFDDAGDFDWVEQFGTSYDDVIWDMAVSQGGELSMVGETSGVFPDQADPGGWDGFVQVFDLGTEKLTRVRQFGNDGNDGVYALAIDDEGSLLLGGYAVGSLDNQPEFGQQDSFVRKLVESSE